MHTTMFCRVMFCETCFRSNYPQLGQRYLVFRTAHNDYQIYSVKAQGVKGFTPHIMRLKKVVNDEVYYEYACSMYPCQDVWRVPNKKGGYDYYVKKWHFGITTLENWQAWERFKDSGYRI